MTDMNSEKLTFLTKRRSLAISAALIGLLATFSPVQAEPAKASIDVDLQIVSDYIWRGHNLLANYDVQRKRSERPVTGAWAFQPSITFNTPLEGLFFNIFGSFAMVGRHDVDVDNRIQTSAGGDFIGPGTSIYDPAFIADGGAAVVSAMPGAADGIAALAGAPGFYKEPVGLRRNDEIDVTLGYEKETNVGVIGFGIAHYSYANSAGKGNPFQGCSGQTVGTTPTVDCSGYYSNEIYFTYALPFFQGLTFAFYSDLLTSAQYYSATYARSFEVTDSVGVFASLGSGYYVFPQIQGISDVTAKLELSFSGFRIGLNAAYRPDRHIQDYNFGYGDPRTRLPVDINGESSAYDGRSVDYSKVYGPVEEYVNALISDQVSSALGVPYTYTPRREIVPIVYWLNFGYSFSID